MDYMTPQQWRDNLIGRVTAFKDPNETEVAEELIPAVRQFQFRRGASNLAASRGPTYNQIPTEQAPVEVVRNFGQQQGGVIPPGRAGLSGRVAAEGLRDDLMSMDTTYLQPEQDQDVDITGPRSMMSKIGGFFNRPGAARDVGAALTSLGAGLGAESSRPGGSAWAGLASGANLATQSLARSREEELRRQMIEQQQQEIDRTRTQEDEDRAAQKKVNDAIAEIMSGWDETTTPEQRVSDYQRAANAAFASGDSPLGRGLIEAARLTIVDPESGPSTSITNFDQIRYRAPDGTPTRGRKRTVTQANGDVEQIFEYVDEDVLENNLDEGMSAADAQINSWRVGGYMADPEEERRLEGEGETRSTQERLNNNLRRAALSGQRGLVVDALTGEPNYLDYKMAGAVATAYDDAGNPVSWERGGLAHIETWQALLGDWISNAGSEVVGGPTKFINMVIRSQLPSEIQEGYTEALNYINPTVRFLSGAQMTNQEAMRYYNALIAMPGDSPKNIELKRRKRDVLTNAMGGAGITEAQKRQAREILGIAPDADMSHAFGDFGLVDDSGVYAMDYYLARLNEHPTLGVSNTFTEDELRQLGRGARSGGSNDPGVFNQP